MYIEVIGYWHVYFALFIGRYVRFLPFLSQVNAFFNLANLKLGHYVRQIILFFLHRKISSYYFYIKCEWKRFHKIPQKRVMVKINTILDFESNITHILYAIYDWRFTNSNAQKLNSLWSCWIEFHFWTVFPWNGRNSFSIETFSLMNDCIFIFRFTWFCIILY